MFAFGRYPVTSVERCTSVRAADVLVRKVAEWLLLRADLWDLTRPNKACTSSIGSAKMAKALKGLGAQHGLKLRVWRFLGGDDGEDDNDPTQHEARASSWSIRCGTCCVCCIPAGINVFPSSTTLV